MKRSFYYATVITLAIIIFSISCTKDIKPFFPWHHGEDNQEPSPAYNLNITLQNGGKSYGYVEFRQDKDTQRIATLNTWVYGLEPGRKYQLQRAVDQTIDGNCTGTAWLTLGSGLAPQAIVTDKQGKGKAELWRALTAIARGTAFDIHFQVIDSATQAVVLSSDCYQYQVR